MKTIVSLLLVFCCYTLKAQITTAQIKNDLAGKEWKIVKYETFGVEEEPKPEQLNDKFILNKDMTFFIVENSKEYLGTWTAAAGKVSCTSKTGEWSRTYKVITLAEKTAAIEYQDQDLTRTLYRLETK
ncbi:MAG: hypothetical protein K0R51_266 [Cytophagaceae bacterium]|jgi:hypothetical protein|nr:hypothetical protein [Cytophagaceae bacterium]